MPRRIAPVSPPTRPLVSFEPAAAVNLSEPLGRQTVSRETVTPLPVYPIVSTAIAGFGLRLTTFLIVPLFVPDTSQYEELIALAPAPTAVPEPVNSTP